MSKIKSSFLIRNWWIKKPKLRNNVYSIHIEISDLPQHTQTVRQRQIIFVLSHLLKTPAISLISSVWKFKSFSSWCLAEYWKTAIFKLQSQLLFHSLLDSSTPQQEHTGQRCHVIKKFWILNGRRQDGLLVLSGRFSSHRWDMQVFEFGRKEMDLVVKQKFR